MPRHPTKSKFSEQPFNPLRNINLEYGISRSLNQLSPELTTNVWQKNLNNPGRKADLDIYVTRYKGTEKQLKNFISHGIEPVFVAEEITGPKGVQNIRSMYPEMDIYGIPEINDIEKNFGWTHAVMDTTITPEQLKHQFPDFEVAEMTFATFVTLGAHIKNISESYPHEFKLNSNINLMSYIGGSECATPFSPNEKKEPTDKLGAWFNNSGKCNVIRRKNSDIDDLTPRFQLNFKPQNPWRI